ncbi:sugar phosphate isomerase/epimerase, partial [Lacticaseibacillus paracasei subsp. paracasei Lpp71]
MVAFCTDGSISSESGANGGFHHPMRFRGQRNELAMNPTKYPTRY